MATCTAYFWMRAKLSYPRIYTHEWYLGNVDSFRFPNGTNRQHLKSLDRFDNELKVQQTLLFGYDEVAYAAYKDSEVSAEKEILPTLIKNIEAVFKAYEKTKKYFVAELCPESNGNNNFKIAANYALIDTSEFLMDLDNASKIKILQGLQKFLKKYTDEPELIAFSNELKSIETERELKPVDFSKSFDFDTVQVIGEQVYIFIYHYAITRALSVDPSHGILDCARYGFTNSLTLLDLHHSIRALYNRINNERQELNIIERKFLPRGLLDHRRRIIELESEAGECEDKLKETVNIANSLYAGLKEPYDANFQKADDYRMKVFSALRDMNSLPNSLFESAGLLEHMELGGLKSIVKDVLPLKAKISLIETRLDQKRLYLFLCLLILIIAIPTAADYALSGQINIPLIADLLEILTFIAALSILVIRVWPARRS